MSLDIFSSAIGKLIRQTQLSCNKYVVSENSYSKNFIHFQEKHPCKIAFLDKVAGYLILMKIFFWEIYEIFRLKMFFREIYEIFRSFHKKHTRKAASAISYHWKMFRLKYIFQKYLNQFF